MAGAPTKRPGSTPPSIPPARPPATLAKEKKGALELGAGGVDQRLRRQPVAAAPAGSTRAARCGRAAGVGENGWTLSSAANSPPR